MTTTMEQPREQQETRYFSARSLARELGVTHVTIRDRSERLGITFSRFWPDRNDYLSEEDAQRLRVQAKELATRTKANSTANN